jgi:hypothetical protein
MTGPAPCRELQGDLAALALGRLDAGEAARVRAHVDGCAGCRVALDDLERTVGVLPLVDPAVLRSEPAPPADLADRILRQVRDERRRDRVRRRHRVLTSALAAAAALLLVAITVFALRDDGASTREFAVREPGVDASFSLEANGVGTAVRLEHAGLDPDDVYWLWLTDASGTRVSAGTFHGSDDRSSLTLQSALPLDAAVRIWVTDADDAVVLDSTL